MPWPLFRLLIIAAAAVITPHDAIIAIICYFADMLSL